MFDEGIVVALGFLLVSSSAAFAADNGLIVTNGSGPTLRSKDVGAGVQAPSAIFVDQTGVFMGAFSNFGTTPGAVPVPGVNASIIGTPTVTISSGTVTVGGTAAVTQSTSPWVVSIPSGNDATQGTTGDAACATDNGTCTLIALIKRNNQNVSSVASVNPGTAALWGIGAFGSAPPANGVAIGALGSDSNLHSISVANYGSTPTGAWAIATNTFVTNTNPNGKTTGSASSPVVLASDQWGDPCYGNAKLTANFVYDQRRADRCWRDQSENLCLLHDHYVFDGCQRIVDRGNRVECLYRVSVVGVGQHNGG